MTSAGHQDRDGGRWLLSQFRHRLPRLREVIADSGFSRTFVDWVRRACGWAVTTATAAKGFKVHPRRWVERTFAWLVSYRRLVKDYERHTETSEAMIHAAMTRAGGFRLQAPKTYSARPATRKSITRAAASGAGPSRPRVSVEHHRAVGEALNPELRDAAGPEFEVGVLGVVAEDQRLEAVARDPASDPGARAAGTGVEVGETQVVTEVVVVGRPGRVSGVGVRIAGVIRPATRQLPPGARRLQAIAGQAVKITWRLRSGLEWWHPTTANPG